MENFTDVYKIGTKKTWGGRSYSVFVTIKYINGKLSLTGVEGPLHSGSCLGGCGQIYENLEECITPAKDWTIDKIIRLKDIWKRWHLNNMRAGNPLQEAYLRMYRKYHNDIDYDYTATLSLLEKANLKTVCGYTYGTKWLKEDVPESILEELRSLSYKSSICSSWEED